MRRRGWALPIAVYKSALCTLGDLGPPVLNQIERQDQRSSSAARDGVLGAVCHVMRIIMDAGTDSVRYIGPNQKGFCK